MLQLDLRPRRGWIVSLLLHAIAAGAIFTVTLPRAVERPYRVVHLYLPPPSVPLPHPRIATPRKLPAAPKLAATPKLEMIPAPARVVPAPVPAPIEAPVAILTPAPAIPPAVSASAFVPPEALAPRRVQVQTGSFEGRATPVNAHPPSLTIETGEFDSSSSVTAKPFRSAVASGAFGDAAPAQSARAEPRRVASTQFDAVATPPARRDASAVAVSDPIEILSKPKPTYTEEARRLRIQGEVVLEVLFRASAQVSVLRVMHGLGHGLNESAAQAAMGIRFRPASAGGVAVDRLATVKIEFQLAD